MAKRKWNEAVDRGIEAYRSGQYVYFYGAKDVILTDATMTALIRAESAYFSRYTAEELEQIRRNSRNRRGIDCSAFTALCTGDKQWSVGQINNCSKYNSLAAGPPGSILFTTWNGRGRHIGLDAGNGFTLQAGWESTDKAILEGRAGIIFSRISDTAWEKSGESNFVDYTGAESPYGPTTQLIEEIFGPTTEVWVGEVYGKALVTVYQNPTGATPLVSYPALALGNLFEVVGDYGNRWQILIANAYIGYIDKQYCLRKTPERTGTVRTDLHLRANAGTSYKSLAIMPRGASVQICDTKPAADGRPWDYVIWNGMYGFASDRYIK